MQKVECTSMMLRAIVRNKNLKGVFSCITVFLTHLLCFFCISFTPLFSLELARQSARENALIFVQIQCAGTFLSLCYQNDTLFCISDFLYLS